jgi:PAS domain S-box-containing protein
MTAKTEQSRILVVDDEPSNIWPLIKDLEREFEVLCATGGEQALQIAKAAKKPDLILLDILMPGMDGYEVCARLKANADTRDIPVIFITALGQEMDEARSLNLGAVDFIAKPFSLPVVEARIKAALRLKEEMDQRILLTRKLEELNQQLEAHVREKTAALKQAHTDLLASEKKYRDIYENAPEGIYQVSLEGRFLSANPAMARILGYASPEELLMHLTDVRHQLYTHPPERDVLLSLLEKKVAIVGHELQFYKKDGQVIWISISARVVRDEAGRPLYLEGFLTDISDRKRLEEQLRQAAKMEAVGNLVGGVAHDFNNLMTAVIGYSDLLLMRLPTDDSSRSAIELIKRAGESAAALTQRLLAFSRKQVLQPLVLDLNAVVANTEKMLQRMIGEDIELVAQCDPALHPILADPGQMEQVIMNLAVNARDAMPRGGKLMIETTNTVLDEAYCRQRLGVQPGRYVMLSVSDTGIGMDAETRSHLFEPFFTTKPRDRGTGLGLATVYGIVKQSRGHIWVYSEAGKGSTFKVYLPAAARQAEQAAQPHKAVQAYRGSETIMVAEDNAGVRELAVAILKAHGYTVLAEDSGQSCLHRLLDRHGPVDLLLTDVVMPDLNGKDLARRAVERFPNLKVLFMSGYTDNVIVRHGVLEKGVHFIQKPFAMEALAAKVREVLDG